MPHIRDLRSELLPKMTFRQRARLAVTPLLEAQRDVVKPKAAALAERAENGDLVEMWRSTMAQAALEFIDRALEREARRTRVRR